MFRRGTIALLTLAAVACDGETIEGSGKFARGSSGAAGGPPEPFEPPKAAPVISSVSPLEGDYGTEVTVTGENFEGAALSLATAMAPLAFRRGESDASAVVEQELVGERDQVQVSVPRGRGGASQFLERDCRRGTLRPLLEAWSARRRWPLATRPAGYGVAECGHDRGCVRRRLRRCHRRLRRRRLHFVARVRSWWHRPHDDEPLR